MLRTGDRKLRHGNPLWQGGLDAGREGDRFNSDALKTAASKGLSCAKKLMNFDAGHLWAGRIPLPGHFEDLFVMSRFDAGHEPNDVEAGQDSNRAFRSRVRVNDGEMFVPCPLHEIDCLFDRPLGVYIELVRTHDVLGAYLVQVFSKESNEGKSGNDTPNFA